MGASAPTPDTFSSSRRFKHAALGLRLRSAGGAETERLDDGAAPARRGGRVRLTSDLLLQVQDDVDGLVQDEQFGLRLVVAEVQLAHPPELLEGLVDVPDPQALPGVVGHSPLPLALHLHLGGNVLVVLVVRAAHTHGSVGRPSARASR